MNMFSYLEPHAICLSPEPLLIRLLVIFNIGIAFAYFAIPLGILQFMRIGRPHTMTYLFAVFIFGCGLTHVMQVVTMYMGGINYWIEAAVCGMTFIASSATALVLFTQGKQIDSYMRSVIKDKDDGRSDLL